MTSNISFSAFVADLKAAGISIRGEETLVKRLESSRDPEVELIKIASNDRASGVSFSADSKMEEGKVVAAFKKVGFDGFAYMNFIELLR